MPEKKGNNLWKWALGISGTALGIYLLRDKTVESVTQLLQQWEPCDYYDTEPEFRADLADFLREEFHEGDLYIIEEHGLGRGRRDVWVKNRSSEKIVVIELKRELDSNSEVQRLIGQIIQYEADADVIIPVFINSDPNHIDSFREAIDRQSVAEKVIPYRLEMEEDEEGDDND